VREVASSNLAVPTIFPFTVMPRSLKIVLLALALFFLILASWVAYHETRVPQNQTEVLNRMIELQREGRYDKAVEVVENWMKDERRDTTHDDSMYGQIAMVYIMKAYKRPGARAESLARAEENLEKELDLFDKENHGELSVDLFEIGGAYEVLGDLSDRAKCHFYEKARQALERQLLLIRGGSYTAYGKTIPLEPMRQEVAEHLNTAGEKSSKAGCQAGSQK
jgi:tetratricopeptide (TPR) repeat protein